MLKKIIIIGIGFACMRSHISYGLDQLKKAKEDIAKAKKELLDTNDALRKGYDASQDDVINEVSNGLKEVSKYKNSVDTYYPLIETIRAVIAANVANPVAMPIAIPALAITGDIPDIVKSVATLLNSIYGVLYRIDTTMSPIMNNLNYGRKERFNKKTKSWEIVTVVTPIDPKGIYKQLDLTIKSFDAVERKLDEVMAGLQSIGQTVQASKPKPGNRKKITIED